jgi:4-hydroxy-4-methyl-2-oxoglutarate aldolase
MDTNRLALPELERLRRLGSCTVSNAVESFGARLRNTGFTDCSVRCIFPAFPPVVGYAATARIRTATSPMEGHSYKDRTEWLNHVRSIPEPRIVVIEDLDAPPGLGSFIGEIHASVLNALGCAGVVTNGAVRDLPAVEAIKFHMFARNVSVSHAYSHILDFGGPVIVGGMKVEPGNLLHGDLHGVLTVPWEIAHKVADAAEEILRREEKVVALCRSSDFSIEKLPDAVKDWM